MDGFLPVCFSDGDGGGAVGAFVPPDPDVLAASLEGNETNPADAASDAVSPDETDEGAVPGVADSAAATEDSASNDEQLSSDSGESQEGETTTAQAGASNEEHDEGQNNEKAKKDGAEEDTDETPPAVMRKWQKNLTQKGQALSQRENELAQREEHLEQRITALQKVLHARKGPQGHPVRSDEEDPFTFNEDGGGRSSSDEAMDIVMRDPRLRAMFDDFASRQREQAAAVEAMQRQQALDDIYTEIEGVADAYGIQQMGAFSPADTLDAYQVALSRRLQRPVSFEEAAEDLRANHPEYFIRKQSPASSAKKKPSKVLPARTAQTPSTGSKRKVSRLGSRESKEELTQILSGTY